jgi:hypothetical protein
VTPELLASIAEESASSSGTLPGAGTGARRQWSWRRGMSVVGAAAVTASLAGLLLARGGGARSHAHERTQPVQTAVAAPAAPAAAAPAPPGAAPAAPQAAAPSPPTPAPAEAAREEGSSTGKHSHRHHHSSRKKAEEDRVTRGLSVDPFAEAQRGK